MAVRERNGSFQADVTVKGVRHRHTFETASAAVQWQEDAKHAAKQGRPIPEPSTKVTQGGGRLETIRHIYDLVVRDNWSMKKSGQALSLNGKLFVEWCGESKPISEIDEALIADYVYHCRSVLGNSNATLNRKMSAIRVMLVMARKRKIISALPEIDRYKESTGSLNYLDFGEEDPILTHLRHRGLDALADLVIVLIDTGARINEILKLDFENVQASGYLHLENRKSGNMSSIPMTKRVRIAFENRRIHSKNPDKPFAELKYRWVKDNLYKVYEHLGGKYENITQPCHVFRHSCASRLAIKGIDASRIKEWMDHSSLVVTQRYIKLAPKDLDVAVLALENEVKPELKVVNDND